MFRRFTLYIDIIADVSDYPNILKTIEDFAGLCEPITNISNTLEKPNFIYDLIIIDYKKIRLSGDDFARIKSSYSKAILYNVPHEQKLLEQLYENGITTALREDFFEFELSSAIQNFMHYEILTMENTLLDNLFKSAQNSIVITDRKGNIQYANPYFERLSEYNKNELIDNSPRIIKTKQHTLDFYRALWETINSGQVWEGIFINQSKNGLLFYEEATITPIRNSHGHIEKFLKIGKNITRERMLLDELSKEVKLAKNVLEAFLPSNHLDSHIKFNYKITAFNELGGDFICFKATPTGTYHMALIDVMGHGPSSAMVAIAVAQMFLDHTNMYTLEENILLINKMLCNVNRDNPDNEKFVSALFIEIDQNTHLINYANMGHPDFLVTDECHQVHAYTSNNMILGVLELTKIQVDVLNGSNVRRIIGFTDGFYENDDIALDEAIQILKELLTQDESSENLFLKFDDQLHIKDDATLFVLNLNK